MSGRLVRAPMNDFAGGGGVQDVQPGNWDWTLALESPSLSDLYTRWSERCRDGLLPVRVFGVVDWLDKGHKRYETVILPLADDGKTVNRFVGAMVFGSAAGRAG